MCAAEVLHMKGLWAMRKAQSTGVREAADAKAPAFCQQRSAYSRDFLTGCSWVAASQRRINPCRQELGVESSGSVAGGVPTVCVFRTGLGALAYALGSRSGKLGDASAYEQVPGTQMLDFCAMRVYVTVSVPCCGSAGGLEPYPYLKFLAVNPRRAKSPGLGGYKRIYHDGLACTGERLRHAPGPWSRQRRVLKPKHLCASAQSGIVNIRDWNCMG